MIATFSALTMFCFVTFVYAVLLDQLLQFFPRDTNHK